MANKNKKQFPLTNKQNCIIYLCRIISSCELCMDKYKIYNEETKEVLSRYKEGDKIPYRKYSSISDKTSNVMCYLLNLLGDCQSTSISYFKYRKQVQKLINKGIEGIKINTIDDEITEILSEFNKLRNWQNHIPESILVSELEMIEAKMMILPSNPMSIIHYQYVSYEYFMDLYKSNINFCCVARKVIQTIKKDYSLLVGSTVAYPRIYTDKPITFKKSEPTIMSAKIQGLKGDYHC